MTTLLLALFSLAPTAAASERPDPRPASELSPDQPSEWDEPLDVTAPSADTDPLPLLIHLYENQDYQGMRSLALQESWRLGQGGESTAQVRYMAALARYELGETGPAQTELDALALEHQDQDIGQLAQLALADSWMQIAPRLGVVQYQAFLEMHPGSSHTVYASQRAAYGLASEGQFSMALSQLEGAEVDITPELTAMLANPPDWKRPVIATFLSGALPGAGQLYAGQPKEAFSALLVNSLFIGGSIYAARNEQWATLGVLAFFGLGFYSGNIYGAADAAIRHNRVIRDDILEQMATEGMGPGEPLMPTLETDSEPAAAAPADPVPIDSAPIDSAPIDTAPVESDPATESSETRGGRVE